MSQAGTKITFDEEALGALPAAPAFVEGLRKQAFTEYLALPIPSQETEEWRYTDLSELDLGFAPFAAGVRAENLDGVDERILQAAGQVGERAGLQIQHNSQVAVTHLDPALAAKGVIFTDLDRAAEEHPDLVEPHLHALVPTSTHEVHGAPWRVPYRRHVRVRARRRGRADAATDAHVARRGRRGRLPAHADRGRARTPR